MSVLVSWLVFPLLLGALALGCGLLLEAACRTRLPGVLVAPAGLCLVIVTGQLLTSLDATAELTAPAVVALAAGGFALSQPGRLRQLDWWALAAATGVLAVYGAPVVLSGEATFAGYVRLDDSSHWLALTNFIMDSGRDLSNVPVSGYQLNLRDYLDSGYPMGSFLPLGIGHVLLDSEAAWLFQPSVALFAATMTLALYWLASQVLESRPLSAAIAFLAGQPALLYGYSLLGGIKEVAAACALATLAALLLVGIERQRRWAALLPAAVACAATLAILSLAGAVWLAAPLLAALAILIGSRGASFAISRAGIFSAAVIVLSIPTLIDASDFLSSTTREVLSSGEELGVLFGPLNPLQVLGIWPADDFRVDPGELVVTYVLLGALVAAAIAGVAYAFVRRAWGPLVFLASTATGCLATAAYGSPWVDTKAFAIASPAFVLIGLIGAAGLARFPGARLVAALAIGAAVAGGVLWSNVLAYRGVNLAPGDRLSELERVGERIAGEGPTLTTEPELYGVRYFLRGAEPESPSIASARPVFLRNGRTLTSFVLRDGKLQRSFADIDRFRVENILLFRTLVLRRSPVASRPPAVFRLVSRGRFYEVWQRPLAPSRPTIAHLSLGNSLQPGAKPRCRDVRRLARRAGGGGMLAAVRRSTAIVAAKPLLAPGELTHSSTVSIVAPGRYGVWVGGGGFRRRVEVLVDGRRVGSDRHRLSPPDQYQPMGEVELTRGMHRIVLHYGDGDLHPGSGGPPRTLGPVVLSKGTAARPVSLVPPADSASLCGQTLDWVEALGP